MDLGVNLSKGVPISALHIQCENAMGARRYLIEGSGVYAPDVISHHQVVNGLLLGFASMGLHVLHLQVGILILHEYYASPVLDVGFSVVLVQQIVSILIVDLDEGYAEGILVLSCFASKLREEIG